MTDQEISSMLADGKTYKDISKITGISAKSIRRRVRKYQDGNPLSRGIQIAWTEELLVEVITMVLARARLGLPPNFRETGGYFSLSLTSHLAIAFQVCGLIRNKNFPQNKQLPEWEWLIDLCPTYEELKQYAQKLLTWASDPENIKKGLSVLEEKPIQEQEAPNFLALRQAITIDPLGVLGVLVNIIEHIYQKVYEE